MKDFLQIVVILEEEMIKLMARMAQNLIVNISVLLTTTHMQNTAVRSAWNTKK